MSKLGLGKLHFNGNEQEPVAIKYRFYVESPAGWRGEFIPQQHRRFREGEGYIIELEDGRWGNCYIRKIVNRVMPTVPPIYAYYFRGIGRFEGPEK
jgi:hypothetical protein